MGELLGEGTTTKQAIVKIASSIQELAEVTRDLAIVVIETRDMTDEIYEKVMGKSYVSKEKE